MGMTLLLMSLAAGPPGAPARIAEIVNVFDPLAWAGSIVVIAAACALASAIPALRAARIDPIATLRQV